VDVLLVEDNLGDIRLAQASSVSPIGHSSPSGASIVAVEDMLDPIALVPRHPARESMRC
jgi:hypothetical protein